MEETPEFWIEMQKQQTGTLSCLGFSSSSEHIYIAIDMLVQTLNLDDKLIQK